MTSFLLPEKSPIFPGGEAFQERAKKIFAHFIGIDAHRAPLQAFHSNQSCSISLREIRFPLYPIDDWRISSVPSMVAVDIR